MVDQIDEFKMSWQQFSKKINRPFLKSLWQDGVICVRKGIVHHVPGFFEGEFLFVNKNSKKFDCSDGWMGVVELDFVLLSEFGEPVIVLVFVSSDDIINGG